MTTSVWEHLVKHAIMGTDHQSFTLPEVPQVLAPLWQQLATKSEAQQLLDSAALLHQYQCTGWQPPHTEIEVSTCPTETLPYCTATQINLLREIISGESKENDPLLTEWLRYATQAQRRVPFEYLPTLLNLGKNNKHIAVHLPTVVGQRGQWLSQQNSAWQYLQQIEFIADTNNNQEVWETGSVGQRLAWLRTCRATNPTQAREALQQTWKQDVAKDRQQFLEVLWEGLSAADEAFLQSCINDRSPNLRLQAAVMLSALPNSDVAQGLVQILSQFIQVESKLAKKSLHITLPDKYEPAWQQFGVIEKWHRSYIGDHRIGRKASWLVQMLLNVRPQQWLAHLQLDALTYLQLARKSDAEALLEETLWSSIAQHRDRETALQLLQPDQKHFVAHCLRFSQDDVSFLPQADREQLFSAFLPQAKREWTLLNQMLHWLPDGLGKHLSQQVMNDFLPNLFTSKKYPYQYATALQDLSLILAPEMWQTLSEQTRTALETIAKNNEPIEQLLRTLQFRYRMQQEFQS